MTNKERLILKIQILRDVRSCMSFNFGAMSETLSIEKMNDIIKEYESMLKGMEINED